VRRKIKIILLYPVIVFLFAVGWFFYTIGDRQISEKAMPKKTNDSGPEEELIAESSDFETGLIEECIESEHLDQ
jgi:hypothetical protein